MPHVTPVLPTVGTPSFRQDFIEESTSIYRMTDVSRREPFFFFPPMKPFSLPSLFIKSILMFQLKKNNNSLWKMFHILGIIWYPLKNYGNLLWCWTYFIGPHHSSKKCLCSAWTAVSKSVSLTTSPTLTLDAPWLSMRTFSFMYSFLG